MTRIQPRIIVVLLLFLAGAASFCTYSRLSSTADEAFHLKCGWEWWEKGRYTLEALHPPLPRVAGTFFPFIFGVNLDKASSTEEMRALYAERLVLSRLGVLPFYLLSCYIVYLWSRQIFGEGAAIWSLATYILLSTVTAHASIATTDMVYCAMLLWALYLGTQWLSNPNSYHSFLLGIGLGLSLGSKFSTVVHWPAAMLLIIAAYWVEKRAFSLTKTHIKTSVLIILPLCLYILGLLYRFDFQTLWKGLQDAYHLNANTFAIWLFGSLQNKSVWYFFPVVFFFKTPLPFLTAVCAGATFIIRSRITQPGQWRASMPMLYSIFAALGILLISMTSQINLGVRHVLPLYPLLAIPAGYGLFRIWKLHLTGKVAACLLLIWQAVGFIQAHPDHLSYFNAAGGKHPERISLDSDFDWGQDMLLLKDAEKRHKIDRIFLCTRKSSWWNAQILMDAHLEACPSRARPGWFAVSRAYRLQNPHLFTWLANYEAVETIGRTMDLYHITKRP